jgi:hypothetical protein
MSSGSYAATLKASKKAILQFLSDQALQGKLKYFQHRDDKHLAQLARADEFGNSINGWTDHGLGDSC